MNMLFVKEKERNARESIQSWWVESTGTQFEKLKKVRTTTNRTPQSYTPGFRDWKWGEINISIFSQSELWVSLSSAIGNLWKCYDLSGEAGEQHAGCFLYQCMLTREMPLQQRCEVFCWHITLKTGRSNDNGGFECIKKRPGTPILPAAY